MFFITRLGRFYSFQDIATIIVLTFLFSGCGGEGSDRNDSARSKQFVITSEAKLELTDYILLNLDTAQLSGYYQAKLEKIQDITASSRVNGAAVDLPTFRLSFDTVAVNVNGLFFENNGLYRLELQQLDSNLKTLGSLGAVTLTLTSASNQSIVDINNTDIVITKPEFTSKTEPPGEQHSQLAEFLGSQIEQFAVAQTAKLTELDKEFLAQIVNLLRIDISTLTTSKITTSELFVLDEISVYLNNVVIPGLQSLPDNLFQAVSRSSLPQGNTACVTALSQATILKLTGAGLGTVVRADSITSSIIPAVIVGALIDGTTANSILSPEGGLSGFIQSCLNDFDEFASNSCSSSVGIKTPNGSCSTANGGIHLPVSQPITGYLACSIETNTSPQPALPGGYDECVTGSGSGSYGGSYNNSDSGGFQESGSTSGSISFNKQVQGITMVLRGHRFSLPFEGPFSQIVLGDSSSVGIDGAVNGQTVSGSYSYVDSGSVGNVQFEESGNGSFSGSIKCSRPPKTCD